jgi:hypothetical protein
MVHSDTNGLLVITQMDPKTGHKEARCCPWTGIR